MAKNYQDLRVFQLAYKLGLEIHKVSLSFPKFELYELGSQIRRSSKSVPANIAEGYGRSKYGAEFVRFLVVALASSDETIVSLRYTYDLKYIDEEKYKYFVDGYNQVGKMLYKLIGVLKNSKPETHNS